MTLPLQMASVEVSADTPLKHFSENSQLAEMKRIPASW